MDITKCSGDKCPIKDRCYRYTAKASNYQSYLIPPFKVVDGVFSCELFSCELFWGEQSQDILNQLKNILNENN